MSLPLSVWIPGHPRPQGSKRAFVTKGGRAVVVDDSKATLRDWRSDVIAALTAAWGGQPPLDEPIGVHLTFYLPRPKKAPKDAVYPAGRVGDIDKLERAVLDALELARVVVDDARVCELTASKYYEGGDGPGVLVWVEALVRRPVPVVEQVPVVHPGQVTVDELGA